MHSVRISPQDDITDPQHLQDRLYKSLGSSFWHNHEESPKLFQWVHTVDAIHNWLEEAKQHYGRFIQHYSQETENLHLPDNYMYERFEDVYSCLDDMDPYLVLRTSRNGTHGERLEEVTRQIADELWSGDFTWLECFSELIVEILANQEEWLIELLQPVIEVESMDPVAVDQHRLCEPGNLVPGGWKKKSSLWLRFLWEWFLGVVILIIVFQWALIVLILIKRAGVLANTISV